MYSSREYNHLCKLITVHCKTNFTLIISLDYSQEVFEVFDLAFAVTLLLCFVLLLLFIGWCDKQVKN